MAPTVRLAGERLQVSAQPLSQQAFAPFGDVLANPRPDVHPSRFAALADSLPPNACAANQGSAIQYRRASRIRNLCAGAEPVASVFVCAARCRHRPVAVAVLERHPFTTQTFTPVSSSAAAYLVVVAPSLPPGDLDKHLPVPCGPDLPGRGLPDLRRLRAFVATSAQAVTYAPGVWHAPMVALGQPKTTLDFVVWQFSTGVAAQDCQLVEYEQVVEVSIPEAARLEKL